MPYAKGQSGNPKGRPKQTAEQKSQKEQFQRLLKSSTVEALQSISRLPMTDITRTDSMLVSTSLTRLMVQILLFF